MGFLKKYLIIVLSAFFLSGCARSVISISTTIDHTTYPMFGGVPERNFFYEGTLSDSLIKKWEADINGGFPGSSVAVHDEFVFVNDLSGRIYCFNINNGKREGLLKYKGAVYTTPVLEGYNVIFAAAYNDESESAFIVYNFLEGKNIKETDIAGRVLTDMIKIKDGVVFTTETGRIYKFDFKGEKVFEFNTKAFSHSVPAMNKNNLIFGNDAGEIISFDIEDQKILFREKISGSSITGVSISGTSAFFCDYAGVIYSADINSGKVLWKYDTGKRIAMTPSYDNENIFIGNLGGELFALNKKTGSLKWKIVTDGVLNSTPLVSENLLVVPDLNKKIHFVAKENGAVTKSMVLEGKAKLSPVYFDDLLFIGYENGILAAYEIIN